MVKPAFNNGPITTLTNTLLGGRPDPMMVGIDSTEIPARKLPDFSAPANPPPAPAAPPASTPALQVGQMNPDTFGALMQDLIDPNHLLDQFMSGQISPAMLKGEKGKYLMMQLQQIQAQSQAMFDAFANMSKKWSDAMDKAANRLA